MKKDLTRFLGEESGPSSVDVLVIPFPYEGTVSYGSGTKEGPQKILEIASTQVEFYDYELKRFPNQEKGVFAVPCESIEGSAEEAHEEILKRTKQHAREYPDAFLLGLGGEHAITYPFVKGLLESGSMSKDVGVLQIDAHTDLRDAYEGNKLSHASVMRRLRDDLNLNTVHVGIRAIGDDEPKYIEKNNVPVFFAPFETSQIPEILSKLPEHIFISFDVDAFDPSIMPSTGTPVPGGLLWNETLELLRAVFGQKNVIAMDIVELAPMKNLHAPDFLVAQLATKCINYYLCL